MGYEDLSAFTEVDPNNVWSQTATRNTGVNVRNDDQSYVYKSYTAGHFGDFEHLVDIHIGTLGYITIIGLYAVTNTLGSLLGLSTGQALYVLAVPPTYYIYIQDFETADSDSISGAFGNTDLYLTLKRVIGTTTFTCKIYTDAARTNLLTTLTITCAATTFEYLLCGLSYGVAPTSANTSNGYSENFDLQEVVVNPYPTHRLRKDVIHGYNCFLQAYVNAKREGYDPLKLPDGTVW